MTEASAPTWQETQKFTKALQTGWMPDVESYLERFPDSINKRLENGTPLFIGVGSKQLKVVQYLVGKGAEIDVPSGYDNKTPLAYAAWLGALDIVKYLHGKGADIHTRDDAKLTPLMHTSRYGHMDVINYLLENGADPAARDNRGQTAADVARSAGKYDAAKFLDPIIGKADGTALADTFTKGAAEKLRIMSPAKLKSAAGKPAP